MIPRVQLVRSAKTGLEYWAVVHERGLSLFNSEDSARTAADAGWVAILTTVPDPSKYAEVSQ